ncbi:MAG: thylakoid lumenal 19 kDa chloroplastic-like [Trebouxia sp. A1-2]|nr:MAG: thylakoid lumenal 19 kDa chloroplastic-like [Trebouxia sp. A1-2]
MASLQLSGLGRHQAAKFRPFSSSHQPVRRSCVRHACTCSASEAPRALDRRETLLSLAAVATALSVNQAEAEGETKTLFGKASPPTSYGGYGGNAKEGAKYTFEYPASWKNDVVNKTEKGMQGIDSRVINPKIGKTQGAFVVTFGRAGEDKKFNKLGDVEATLQGFAGADYDLQDALVGATDKKNSQHEKDGELFYDYEVTGADLHYLASITLKSGKVFALFVKSPTKNYAVDRDKLKAIVDSFTIL